MEAELLETWAIANRIDIYLLDAIPEGGLAANGNPGKRTVFQLFVHIHNVRLMWLKSAAPDLLARVEKLEGADGTAAQVRAALEASGAAIEALLRFAIANGGRVKGFKPHVTAFAGYLIAHDAYHRAQIVAKLKLAGLSIDDKTDYGMWEWGVR
jgi:uncharacterized damage-inducible protein DinB